MNNCKECHFWYPYSYADKQLGECVVLKDELDFDLSYMRVLSGNELIDETSEILKVNTWNNFGCIKWEQEE